MKSLTRAAIGVGGAALWLAMLTATDFSSLVVSLGLLAGVVMIGRQ
ncbi:MAG: hypothetical protein JOZ41_22320 [Chloroflexi bacterium]|nr:hypothetical protein [Chloroflexota bacterium]